MKELKREREKASHRGREKDHNRERGRKERIKGCQVSSEQLKSADDLFFPLFAAASVGR